MITAGDRAERHHLQHRAQGLLRGAQAGDQRHINGVVSNGVVPKSQVWEG